MPLKVNRNSYIHKRMNLWSCILYLLMHLCNFTSFFCNLSTVLNIICIRYTYATITLIALYSQVWNWDKLLKFISFSRLLFLNISSQLVCSLLKKGAMQTPNVMLTLISISKGELKTMLLQNEFQLVVANSGSRVAISVCLPSFATKCEKFYIPNLHT